MARAQLRQMEGDRDGPMEVPGDIHLSDVSYELHSDGTNQFRVLLASRNPERDEGVRAELQRSLREADGRKCAVELIRGPARRVEGHGPPSN